jgi:protein O-mannosyl-transferase
VASVGAQAKRKRKSTPSRDSGWLTSPAKQRLLLGLLLVVATLVLYWPVNHHPFVNYDDDEYITVNAHVQSGLGWSTVKWAFTTYDEANWHPLTWLSHALDYQLFQLNPAGHHDVNLFWHLLNVLLWFWVLQNATGYLGRSAMVAALFAVHPINVETVVWVAERKNLLSMFFFLLALGAYRWYASTPTSATAALVVGPGARERQVGRYAVVVFLYVLGLMAKPQVITLPFVLLLWDYWPLRRMFAGEEKPDTQASAIIPAKSFSWLVLEKVPLLVLSAASAFITMKAQRFGGGINPDVPLSSRLGNAIVSYPRYLGKAFWPVHLAPMYPLPGHSLRTWQVLAALLLLLAITALAFAARHRHRYLLVGWLWFLGTLVPMIGLVQVGVQAMADRYAYLTFVGLFIMLCWGVADLYPEKIGESSGLQKRTEPRRVVLAGISVLVLLGLMVVTHRQIDYWNESVTLWEHTLQVTGPNWVAENNLAHALLNEGQEEDAIVHFRAAVAINPSDADSTLNMGAYEQAHKNLPGAIELYKKMIAMTKDTARLNAPKRALTFRNMGHAYREMKDYADARDCYQQAVELNPGDGVSWLGLGLMAHKLGDLNTAILGYTNALKVEPINWVYILLARALEQSGRKEEARAAMQQASLLSKDFEQAQRAADGVFAR